MKDKKDNDNQTHGRQTLLSFVILVWICKMIITYGGL